MEVRIATREGVRSEGVTRLVLAFMKECQVLCFPVFREVGAWRRHAAATGGYAPPGRDRRRSDPASIVSASAAHAYGPCTSLGLRIS